MYYYLSILGDTMENFKDIKQIKIPQFDIYFDPYKVLTYNSYLYEIVGGRGCGKSFGAKYFCIKQAITQGKQFAYIRRYDTELEKGLATFFNDVREYFSNCEFKVKGNLLYCNEIVIGYGFALTKSIISKSSSFPFVDNIIFEEFILEKGVYSYLSDECEKFLGLLSTIQRNRNAKVLLLGNNESSFNPYFSYFKTELPPPGKYYRYINDGKGNFIKTNKGNNFQIFIQNYYNKKLLEIQEESQIGMLTAGLNFSKFAFHNEEHFVNESMLEKKTGRCSFKCSCIIKSEKIGIWYSIEKGLYYISEDFDPSSYLIYTFSSSEHTENTVFCKSLKDNYLLRNVFEMYGSGFVRFETKKCKSLFLEMLRLYRW